MGFDGVCTRAYDSGLSDHFRRFTHAPLHNCSASVCSDIQSEFQFISLLIGSSRLGAMCNYEELETIPERGS